MRTPDGEMIFVTGHFVFRYVGGFRRGVVAGPGTIYETNGNIRCDATDAPPQGRILVANRMSDDLKNRQESLNNQTS